ncbi:VanZ family protein [Bacillus sp. SM2101]|uniref:VanZ family protein n=1 Tax=Bacillus sp. SM2101 TaxID=2805366 RepID=UPI001BDE8A9E|nr:VanZ family protein [Bacillus sp. SM2101]
MKQKAVLILIWLSVISCAAVIFYFSSQPYSQQDLRPQLAKYIDKQWIIDYFSHIQFTYSGSEISVASKGPYSFLEFFIRKGAHFFIYFLLGFLTLNALAMIFRNKWKCMIYAMSFIIIYAASDEIHQMFTGSRSPLIADVLLDSFGGLVGIVTAAIIFRKSVKITGFYVFKK